MKKTTTVILLIIMFTFNVQAQNWWSSNKVKGNGKLVTKNRQVEHFEKVSVSGFFDVILKEGKEGKIVVEAEENIVPYIITEVRGGKLKIKTKDRVNISTRKKILVTVCFDNIRSLSLGGSGSVLVKKKIQDEEVSFSLGGSGNIKALVEAEEVAASIGGSGTIELSGTTGKLKSSIGGSGGVEAYELKANTVKVSIAGSGNVECYAKNKVKANIVGSGDVYYKGNPKYVDEKSLGSGSLIKKD